MGTSRSLPALPATAVPAPLPASLLDALFDASRDGHCLVGGNGAVLRANARWLASTGYALEDVLGRDILALFPQTHDMAVALHAHARAGHRVQVPRHAQVVNGRRTWWEGTIAPVDVVGGTGLLITAREVGASPAGAGGQDALHAVVETLEDVIYAKDLQGRMLWANPATLALVGKPAEQVLGRTDAQFLDDPQAARTVMANDRGVMDGGEPAELEERVPWADGSERVWLSRKVPWRDAAGRVIGLLGISRDITERRQEQRRQEELARQRQLALDSARMGWWHLDPVAQVVQVDRRFQEIFDARETDIAYGRVLDLVHPDDASRVHAAVQAALDPLGSGVYAIEYRVRAAGGQRWVEAHGQAWFEGEGAARRAVRFAGTVQDITARRQQQRELREARRLMRSTLDHFPTAIAFKDVHGRFIEVNRALEEILQRPRAQILGLAATDLLGEAGAQDIVAHEREVMRTRRAVQAEHERRLPGRPPLVFLDTVFPLVGEAGEVEGVGYISHDITSLKRAEGELNAVNGQLKAADRQKDEFIAMLGHELRNPLAPIRMSAELIRLRQVPDAAVERARAIIERQVEHLTRLVDDLLDVSRITFGTVQLHREPVDLGALARSAAEAAQAQFDAAGIAFALQVDGQPRVLGDATRLGQCMANLLGNAAKFTPAGGRVHMTVQAAAGLAVLEVADDGAGIAPANLERIFELFVQEHRSGVQGNRGLGIGLALTRRLVGLHGGTVRASSDGIGHGSRFRIELPLLEAGVTDEPPPTGAAAVPSRHAVLVVDDNVDAADTLADMLDMSGYEVRVAYTGEDAVDLAGDWRPAALVLDIGLPGIDGYEVCRRLRAQPSWRPAIVALTGWGQARDRERALDVGFDAHLTKPADPGRLLGLLDGLLRSVPAG